jgi:hypothetical protein
MITEIKNGKLCQGRVLSNTKTRFEKFFPEFVKDIFYMLTCVYEKNCFRQQQEIYGDKFCGIVRFDMSTSNTHFRAPVLMGSKL